ncbi:MAG: hypothetical protein ACOYOT_00535 [Bacteroidales bacterium]
MKAKLLIAAFLLLSISGFAQKPIWGLDFLSFFDNREYNDHYAISQTYFGTRITPEVAFSVDDHQKLVGGLGLLFEDGKKPLQEDPDYQIYYQYNSTKFSANAGYFPRSRMMGAFPNVFLRGSLNYYQPNMSGLLLQSKSDKGFAEIAIDWNGMRTDSVRESFLLLSAGKHTANRFYFGYHFTYFHFARAWDAPDSQHLVDNALAHLFVGYNFTPKQNADSIYAQIGYMQGAERIRGIGTSFMPGGLYAEVYFKHKNIGIKNSLYLGDHQMNLYNVKDEKGIPYGERVYWNEPFFQSNCYNRTEFFWNIAETKRTAIKLSSVHHFDGDSFGWQQVLTFRVKI